MAGAEFDVQGRGGSSVCAGEGALHIIADCDLRLIARPAQGSPRISPDPNPYPS